MSENAEGANRIPGAQDLGEITTLRNELARLSRLVTALDEKVREAELTTLAIARLVLRANPGLMTDLNSALTSIGSGDQSEKIADLIRTACH